MTTKDKWQKKKNYKNLKITKSYNQQKVMKSDWKLQMMKILQIMKYDKWQKVTSHQKWHLTGDKGKMRNDKGCDICPINSCYITLVKNSTPSPL